ncbi:hypothetical protein CPB86DRAFT_227158 [Serendipita vermifera]|nr:hypothetical protein CPB86DRAFT_227158 [Serendipita vermifera]
MTKYSGTRRFAWEKVPVELWQGILSTCLNSTFQVIDSSSHMDQKSFEAALRADTEGKGHALCQHERCRRSLRGVCHSWRSFVDKLVGGWMEVKEREPDSQGTPFQDTIHAVERLDVVSLKACSTLKRSIQARILTISSPTSSIDKFISRHGQYFPHLEVLDLRPASSYLSPNAGVTGGKGFFLQLATLFPNLITLLIELPSATEIDILSFPQLRRLSYTIKDQSRLSDSKRCGQMDRWHLPLIQHVRFEPVGCTKDWDMVMDGLEIWGGRVETLCWSATFTDPSGIVIKDADWRKCASLKSMECEREVVRSQTSDETDDRGDAVTTTTPAWHPFHSFFPTRN